MVAADLSGRTDLAIGDISESGAKIEEFEAEAGITKGAPVYLSSSGKVTMAAAAQRCIGVATKTVLIGQMCPVCTRGKIKVYAGGAIALGATVYGSDASHQVLTNAYAADILMVNNNFAYALNAGLESGDQILIKVTK